MLAQAIGMEEGEELAIGSGRTVVATSAAMVASPDDPFEADQFGTTAAHEDPYAPYLSFHAFCIPVT